MFLHQGDEGQRPAHWQTPTAQQPADGSYAQPPHIDTTLPPPLPQETRPNMTQYPQYQHQQPVPNEWTRAPPPPDYRQHPAPPPQYVQQHGQPPAPRQRTAIACRYCRRRKIRCSGFEVTEDGRCSNCIRFNQDCLFTPVSAQTQAFVPAHTVWRGVGQPPPMYGAYGQPLPPTSYCEPCVQPSRQPQYLPSSTKGLYLANSDYSRFSASPNEASFDRLACKKRLHPEPHTPILLPPHPGSVLQAPRLDTEEGHAYSETLSRTSADPTRNNLTLYFSAPPPAQPYYAAQPSRQGSPHSTYRYQPSRTPFPPHSQAPAAPGVPPMPYHAAPPLLPPALSDGRIPPLLTSQASARPSTRINDPVSDIGSARSSTDSSMLNMLNRRPM